MLPPTCLVSACLTAALAVALPLPALAAAELVNVAATDSEVVLTLAGTSPNPIAIHTATVWESDDQALRRPPLWTGSPHPPLRLPRFEDGHDRLFDRFLMTDASGDLVAPGRCVTDLTDLASDAPALPQPTTVKGLQSVCDIDDALSLGVEHVAINVSLASLLAPAGGSGPCRIVDGVPVCASAAYLRRLDQSITRFTAAGVRVNLIILNILPRGGRLTPLVHPRTDLAAPNRIGAFNLTDAAGTRLFRGLMELLAQRYSRPDAQSGLVAGYIIGNEVQSHHDWYNLGPADAATVAAEYTKAVRVADLAVRRFQPDARVYISLDHHWTRSHRPPTAQGPSLQSLPGRELLDRLHAILVAEGDIPYGVAFHPYPENLGNPRTWADATATFNVETPRVTFKNLEVLVAYLRRPEMRYQGEPRRLLLSEQGFHCPATPNGEALQAAAYAYAYERVRQVGGVEAFLYHRHVDHPGEGGLRLGLRENVPGTIDRPGRMRQIYSLFRDIDKPGAADFALPIIGVQTWQELAPQPVTGE